MAFIFLDFNCWFGKNIQCIIGTTGLTHPERLVDWAWADRVSFLHPLHSPSSPSGTGSSFPTSSWSRLLPGTKPDYRYCIIYRVIYYKRFDPQIVVFCYAVLSVLFSLLIYCLWTTKGWKFVIMFETQVLQKLSDLKRLCQEIELHFDTLSMYIYRQVCLKPAPGVSTQQRPSEDLIHVSYSSWSKHFWGVFIFW